MSLKKLTFNEKRKIWLEGIEKSLLDFEFLLGGWKFGYQTILDELFSRAVLPSKDILICIREHYGSTEDEEDIEFKLVKMLFLQTVLSWYSIVGSFNQYEQSPKSVFSLISNTSLKIREYLPEYDIKTFQPQTFTTYETKEIKTVIDNLANIPETLADPIKELLQPMKSEEELIGLISKVHSSFEKTKVDKLKNLNTVDKSIYENVWKLAKQIINNVDSAKGHKGESELTVKDIAHNFALNASLIQKLIHINNEKE